MKKKQKKTIHHGQARREPQRGQEKNSHGAAKHCWGFLWGENFDIFFKMVHSGRRRGPPNVAGPAVAYPLTPPSLRA